MYNHMICRRPSESPCTRISISTATGLVGRFLLLIVLIALLTLSAFTARGVSGMTVPRNASTQATTRSDDQWGKMPLYFVANQGQIDERVAYYVSGSDKALYFTPDGIIFALTQAESRWVFRLDFLGANRVWPVGQNKTDAIVSYFKGSPDKWHTGLPTYTQIVYDDVWRGVDLLYSGTVDRLKYEFVVQPGADPARIRLAYRGASVRVDEAGQLEVSTPVGSFHDDAPVAYQEVDGQRVPVAVSYALDNNATYGFRVNAYDPTLPLVIDPAVLVYCGYIGGAGQDYGRSIAVDGSGAAYVTGRADSSETSFPDGDGFGALSGPDTTYNGATDAFVAKVKADGTGLVYAGYIGGSSDEEGWGIAVDGSGAAYVSGYTRSTEASFPVLGGPDTTHNGGRDGFVVKVNAEGTGLVYAGYIGGSGDDYGRHVAVDGSGAVYLTGWTASDEVTFPDGDGFGSLTGPDTTHNGGGDLTGYDAFVAKVNAGGTGLVYAGYIGGSGDDYSRAIAVEGSGAAYVMGDTNSTQASFPDGDGFGALSGPDTTHNGGSDAFVAKVKADGTGLVYAGYVGGAGTDSGEDLTLAVDGSGVAYVVGWTSSTEATFPDGDGFGALSGPDTTHNGAADAFVAKVKADGTGLVYAGYIGGSSDDEGIGIAVDGSGAAYVSGYTHSEAGFPVVDGPDPTYNGGYWDAFVAKVRANGSGLIYCGYIGGSANDSGLDIAVDGSGAVYVTGETKSSDVTFPVLGPDTTYNGVADAWVAKVSYTAPPVFQVYLPLVLRQAQ